MYWRAGQKRGRVSAQSCRACVLRKFARVSLSLKHKLKHKHKLTHIVTKSNGVLSSSSHSTATISRLLNYLRIPL
jgi:hypothetical protein